MLHSTYLQVETLEYGYPDRTGVKQPSKDVHAFFKVQLGKICMSKQKTNEVRYTSI